MKINKDSTVFKCKWCDVVFKSKQGRCRHQRQCKFAPESLSTPHKCSKCSYETVRKDAFTRHKVSCQKKKSKDCPVCQRKFNRLTHLSKHMKTHDRQKYQCETCSRTFKRVDHYNNHVSTQCQVLTSAIDSLNLDDPFGFNELLDGNLRSFYSMSIQEVRH